MNSYCKFFLSRCKVESTSFLFFVFCSENVILCTLRTCQNGADAGSVSARLWSGIGIFCGMFAGSVSPFMTSVYKVKACYSFGNLIIYICINRQ